MENARLKRFTSSLRTQHLKNDTTLTSRLQDVVKTLMIETQQSDKDFEEWQLICNLSSMAAELKQLFITYDTDHNDKITWDEFLKLSDSLNIKALKKRIKKAFEKSDRNHDGWISLAEFLKLCLNADLRIFKPQAQVDFLFRMARKVEDALKEKNDEIANLEGKCTHLEADNARVEDENKRLLLELEKSKTKQEELNKRMDDMNEERIQKDKELRDLEGRLTELQEDNASLQQKIHSLHTREKELQEEFGMKTMKDLQEHLEAIDLKDEELAELVERTARLTEHCTNLRTRAYSQEFDISKWLFGITEQLMEVLGVREPALMEEIFQNIDLRKRLRLAYVSNDTYHTNRMDKPGFQEALDFVGIQFPEHEKNRIYRESETLTEHQFLKQIMSDANQAYRNPNQVHRIYELTEMLDEQLNQGGRDRQAMFDENRDLRNQLTEALKKIEDLEHQLTETENTFKLQIQELKENELKLHGEIDALKSEIGFKNKEIEDKKAELQSMAEDYQRIVQKLQDAKREIQRLLDELENLRRNFTSEDKNRIMELLREIERLKKFGRISRNTVNQLENMVCSNLRDAIRNCKVIAELPPENIAAHDKLREKIDLVFQLRQAFIEIDTDHSGTMDFEEFQRGYQWVGISAPQVQLKKTFDSFDTDNSGRISEREFMTAVLKEPSENVSISHFTQELHDHMRLLGKKTSTLQMDKKVLRQENTKIIEKVKILQRDTQELHHENDNLIAQLDGFDSQIRDAKQNLITHDKRIKAYEDRIKELLRKTVALEEDKAEMDALNEKLLQSLEEIHATHQQTLKDHKEHVAKLNEDIEKEKEKAADLARDLAQLRAYIINLRKEHIYLDDHLSNKLREGIRKILEFQGVDPNGMQRFDDETGKVNLVNQLKQAFLELDEDQSLQMEFPDFVNAWKWLELKGDETTLASVFSKIDQDKDGVINETEFIMAVMQEETDFEHLTHPAQVQKTTLAIDQLLERSMEIENECEILRDSVKTLAEQAAKVPPLEEENTTLATDVDNLLHENKDLQRQLENVTNELAGVAQSLAQSKEQNRHDLSRFDLILSLFVENMTTGMKDIRLCKGETMQPMDMSESEMVKRIGQHINDYDHNNRGSLSKLDFQSAMEAMRFTGPLVEKMFADNQNDGQIDTDCITPLLFKDMLIESYIKSTFDHHGELLNDLLGFIEKLQQTNQEQAETIEELENQMRAESLTNARRRAEFNDREKDIWQRLIDKLPAEKDPQAEERRQQYLNSLKVFITADDNHDAQLNFAEFQKAWEMLGARGNSTAQKRAFLRLDSDRSGGLSFREFLAATLGDDDANNLGLREEVEGLLILLENMEDEVTKREKQIENLLDDQKKRDETIEKQNELIEELKRKLKEYKDALKQTKMQLEEAKMKLARLLDENKDRHQSELDALASSNVTLLELVDLLKNRFHKNNSVYNNVLKMGKNNETGMKDTQNTLVQEHLATMDNLTGETLSAQKELEKKEESNTLLLKPLRKEKQSLIAEVTQLKFIISQQEAEIGHLQLLLDSLQFAAEKSRIDLVTKAQNHAAKDIGSKPAFY